MSTMPSIINRFVDYYVGLDSQPSSALAMLYHPDGELIDPFGKHQGLSAIQRYFAHLLENVNHCRFAIDTPVGDSHRFAVTWTMHWAHPRISKGQPLSLTGCSMVEIRDDLILCQRDFYDAGEMLYEHLPLLGWAIRGVKRRMC